MIVTLAYAERGLRYRIRTLKKKLAEAERELIALREHAPRNLLDIEAVQQRTGLMPLTCEMLLTMARRPNAGLSWPDDPAQRKSVQVHVRAMRRALPEGLIVTRMGVGYALRPGWREAVPWLAEIVAQRKEAA